MTLALALGAGAGIVGVAWLGSVAFARHRWPASASLVARTIVVHTRKPDDRSIRGTIHGELPESGWIVLSNAEYLQRDGAAAAGGYVRIPVVGVSSVQDFEPADERPVTP